MMRRLVCPVSKARRKAGQSKRRRAICAFFMWLPDVIERQLAHCERNKVRAAYNHAQYLSERRKMMQWWADCLDGKATARTD
jgi:hypothetical protein